MDPLIRCDVDGNTPKVGHEEGTEEDIKEDVEEEVDQGEAL